MRRLLLPTLFTLSLSLAACNFSAAPTSSETEASSSSSSEASQNLVTHNVSYIGTIEEIGMTTYMQGTHRLSIDNEQFLLLESTDVNLNLNTYLGKKVEVHGSVQPTVEEGGMLLKAEEVIVLDVLTETSSSSSEQTEVTSAMCGGIGGIACNDREDCIDDPRDSCDPMNGGADCSGICVPKSTVTSSSTVSSSEISSSVLSTTSSSAPKPSSAKSSSTPSSSAVSSSLTSSSSISVPADSAAMEQQNALLAKQVYDQDSLWTQKYCTSHIAFCVPVHKNWYFKSFGATTSNLWHIELGMVDIAELGDGAIIINLVSGSSASMQAQDGQIKTRGSDVIGFKDWDDNTHFEIIADARLKSAVAYMLSRITPYPGAQ